MTLLSLTGEAVPQPPGSRVDCTELCGANQWECGALMTPKK